MMWKTIKQYYLDLFLLFLILFTLMFFIGYLAHKGSAYSLTVDILIIISFSLVLTVIVGSLYYFMDNYWGPKSRQKTLLKNPFKELLSNQFILQDDCLIGIVEGYTTLIKHEWRPHTCINIQVLCDPRFENRYYTLNELKQILKKSGRNKWNDNTITYWTRFSIMFEMPYYRFFRLSSSQEVMHEVEELIGILRQAELKPISLEEKEKMELILQNETIQ